MVALRNDLIRQIAEAMNVLRNGLVKLIVERTGDALDQLDAMGRCCRTDRHGSARGG